MPYELTALQRLFLYTRADTIYGGSNQIQRNIIGERALGLPPEPKVSRRDRAPPDVRRPGTACSRARRVLVTAAAGTGIGFATAEALRSRKAHGSSISDIHERRLGEAADAARRRRRGRRSPCDVTVEDDVQALVAGAAAAARRASTCS